jgi:hypothetical protein
VEQSTYHLIRLRLVSTSPGHVATCVAYWSYESLRRSAVKPPLREAPLANVAVVYCSYATRFFMKSQCTRVSAVSSASLAQLVHRATVLIGLTATTSTCAMSSSAPQPSHARRGVSCSLRRRLCHGIPVTMHCSPHAPRFFPISRCTALYVCISTCHVVLRLSCSLCTAPRFFTIFLGHRSPSASTTYVDCLFRPTISLTRTWRAPPAIRLLPQVQR